MRSEKDKMLAGELYRADSPELIADNRRISAWMERFNATGATPEARNATMRLTCLAALAGLPAVSLPVRTDAGLPAGVCLVAAPGRDRDLLDLVQEDTRC